MTLPLNPNKTTAGIIVDPTTLERIVPASKRSDGTTRKVQKIRPGFTPVEDISRYRPARAIEADATRGTIPGSGVRSSTSGGRDSARNPTNTSDPPSTSGRSQTKNVERGDGEGKAWRGVDWDTDDASIERVNEVDDVIDKLGAIDISGRGKGIGGAPKEGISTLTDRNTQYASVPAYNGPKYPSRPTDPISNPPPASTSDVAGSSLVSAEKTERDWKAAKPPSERSEPSRHSGQGEGADRGGRWVRGGAPLSYSASSGRSRGGPPSGSSQRSRDGPTPVSSPRDKSDSSPRDKPGFSPRGKTEPETRIRKEIKIRGGAAGSLADQVKGTLAGNAEIDKRKKDVDGDGDGRSKS